MTHNHNHDPHPLAQVVPDHDAGPDLPWPPRWFAADRRLTLQSLPSKDPVLCDVTAIVCARVEGSIVAVHTNQGFSFALTPETNESVGELFDRLQRVIASTYGEMQ